MAVAAGRFTLYRNTSLNASLFVVWVLLLALYQQLIVLILAVNWFSSFTLALSSLMQFDFTGEADESLDIVFLDARHDYEAGPTGSVEALPLVPRCQAVLDDVMVWKPKVRRGGILSGGVRVGRGLNLLVDKDGGLCATDAM